MAIEIYNTHTLLGVMRDLPAQSSYWLDLAFPNVLTSQDEYIDFEEVVKGRKLAPFVAPMAQGKPIYKDGYTAKRFKPAYIKLKDPITPNRTIKRRAGEGIGGSLNPKQREQAILVDIMREHREAIFRRMEWMAASAIIDGKVTVEGEDYPTQVVDFQRDANHTITLGAGSRWGEAGVSIVSDIESWRSMVLKAKLGGPTNRLTVGVDAWEVMRKDAELLQLLDTNTRGTRANFDIGIGAGGVAEYKGDLAPGLELWVYSDYYENASGTEVPFMSPKDVVLTGPNIDGYRCFGAIMDARSGYQPLEIFSKMFEQEDPSAIFVMNQSAPLLVPGRPNNTLKATVLG